MAKFLNTSATNYFLEELIKNATDRLVLISPYLKLNDRIKELLEDKNRLKIDVRIVYGKNELQPQEINWLNELTFVRTSFCKNLHAKCYINEEYCIVTSLNLHEFSQVNNNEMGIYISRAEDMDVYRDAYEEAQRIIRISDEIRISLEKVVPINESKADNRKDDEIPKKLSTSKLARKHKMKTNEMLIRLKNNKYLEDVDDEARLTQSAINIGAERISSARFGKYFIWPEGIRLDKAI